MVPLGSPGRAIRAHRVEKRELRAGRSLLVLLCLLCVSTTFLACRRSVATPPTTPLATEVSPVVRVATPVFSPMVTPTPAPSVTATPTATSRGIVEAGFEEPRTLNPLFVADPLSDALSHLVFDGLVAVDPTSGKLVPALAESWDVNSEGTVYTFHLRDNIRWHDGQPFSARDVLFTYNRLLDPDVRSPRYSRLAERVKSVDLVDERTIRIALIRADTSFLPTLATIGIVPEHVLGSLLPQQLITDPFGLSSAVGTGPFILTQWLRGVSLTFRANPDYYRGAPAVPSYTYQLVTSVEELAAGLRNGTIDWAVLNAEQARQLPADPAIMLERYPGYELVLVAWQLDPAKNKLFADERVRRALLLALDRATLVESVWHGFARVAHGLQPPASWAAETPDQTYPYDPEEARRLLTEAGWVPGDDGIRVREGQRFHFRLLATGADPLRQTLAEKLQQQWRAIGIDVELDLASWAEVRRRATETRDFDALLIGILWDIDPDQSAVWSSDSFFDGLNFGHYLNPTVDQLLIDAVATSDRARRTELYQAIEQHVLSDLPVAPLAFPDCLVVRSARLEAPALNALVVRTRSGIEQWRIRSN